MQTDSNLLPKKNPKQNSSQNTSPTPPPAQKKKQKTKHQKNQRQKNLEAKNGAQLFHLRCPRTFCVIPTVQNSTDIL